MIWTCRPRIGQLLCFQEPPARKVWVGEKGDVGVVVRTPLISMTSVLDISSVSTKELKLCSVVMAFRRSPFEISTTVSKPYHSDLLVTSSWFRGAIVTSALMARFSSLQICLSLFCITWPSKGLNRNFAQRDAKGSMILIVESELTYTKTNHFVLRITC